VSAHPLHGTAPLSRALRVEVRDARAPESLLGRVQLWKVNPAREGWGSNGGRFFTGTRMQAEARAVSMGIPSSEIMGA
jgi:hypothetical protein